MKEKNSCNTNEKKWKKKVKVSEKERKKKEKKKGISGWNGRKNYLKEWMKEEKV